MKLGVIDIGSNSIKLLIAETVAGGATEFRRLASVKEPVRLGRETLRAGHLSDAAIARAGDAIARFREQTNGAGVEHLYAIATASVREADNAAQFVAEIRRRTKVEVEVLSGVEEARLIGLAAWRGLMKSDAGDEALVNIDIGGGSTEITLVEAGEPAELFSVKAGAVRATESFVTTDPPKRGDLRRLRDEIAGAFEGPAREMRGARWNLASGTSGTIVAIGEALRSDIARDDSRKNDNGKNGGRADQTKPDSVFTSATINIDALARFNARMARATLAERREERGISQQRAEIIIAGGTILEEAMRALGIQNLLTTDWALREGVVVDRLREMEAERLPPVPDSEDPRLRSVRSVGERFRYEADHARRVAHLAERIFDQTIALHRLTRHHRTLLAAAALLHDVGYAVAHDSHHKHSQYIIRNAELTGFTETERAIISLVARYHRRALPKDRHADFAALDLAARDMIWRLGGILRIAEALDRHHDGRVRDVTCHIAETPARVIRLVLDCAADCDREVRAVEINSEMLAQAFGCAVVCHTTDIPAAAIQTI